MSRLISSWSWATMCMFNKTLWISVQTGKSVNKLHWPKLSYPTGNIASPAPHILAINSTEGQFMLLLGEPYGATWRIATEVKCGFTYVYFVRIWICCRCVEHGSSSVGHGTYTIHCMHMYQSRRRSCAITPPRAQSYYCGHTKQSVEAGAEKMIEPHFVKYTARTEFIRVTSLAQGEKLLRDYRRTADTWHALGHAGTKT